MPFTGIVGFNFSWIHDNDLHAVDIVLMEWPLLNLDLNPFMVFMGLPKKEGPANHNQLVDEVIEEWENILREWIENLIASMARGANAANRGWGRRTFNHLILLLLHCFNKFDVLSYRDVSWMLICDHLQRIVSSTFWSELPSA